ncbi:MAG: polysaccharide deacetylase family protein [Saprospiraceae bacterium]|nr:polysaccharide deacetylase family protein [Saprospiraceae bacterium]
MRTIQSAANAALTVVSNKINYLVEHVLPHKGYGKRKKYFWIICGISVAISYNSCGIHFNKNLITAEAKPAIAAAMDSTKIATPSIKALNQKTIYLTFDDGPNRGTAKVMNLLQKANLPATFFLVGSHIHGSQKQWGEYQAILKNPAFEAANHTYFHAKNRYVQFYKNPAAALEDFQLMQDSLQLSTKIGRTPGCNTWRTTDITEDVDRRSRKAADLLKSEGFTLLGWDVEWKANGKQQLKSTAAELAKEIEKQFAERLNKTDDHLVLLLHDQHFVDSTNVQALEDLIVELTADGYRFEKAGNYPCL